KHVSHGLRGCGTYRGVLGRKADSPKICHTSAADHEAEFKFGRSESLYKFSEVTIYMKRISRRKLIMSVMALSMLAVGIIGGRQIYINSPGYGLPYYAIFTPDVEDRWTALGGAWEIVEGAMRNDSNDRGAKLLMGSPNWKDYIVEADVQLQGQGSEGG